jgi:hypothetical protein
VAQVAVTDFPVMTDDQTGDRRDIEARALIPERVTALVLVSAANDAAKRAVNYARSLHATETRAVYFALDPGEIEEIQRGWERAQIPMELDIVEAPFRDLGPPILEEVRRETSRPSSVAAVVIPEIVPTRWWHVFLHNQRALYIKRLLLFEHNVALSSVPYRLD